MSNKRNYYWWLSEQDTPMAAGQGDPAGGQAPQVQPGIGGEQGTAQMGDDPNVANQPEEPAGGEPEDVSGDPQTPDMPEEKGDEDFEIWKNNYFKESIKGDSNILIDLLNEVRDRDGLESYQRKFVEDNLNIQFLRQNSNIEKASREIRKLLKEQLDQNNPATSVVGHLVDVLATVPQLNNIFIKLNGYGNQKADLHRKFIAALTGSVQVGSGANNADIIFNERQYSIMMSTRFNAEWGNVSIGNWSLKEDDPSRYLSEPELKRLAEGSPEEKDVLLRRVVVESLTDQFKQRAFVINVVGDDGTIYCLGWDIANAIMGAYTDGKLVVRTRHSDNSDAMIDDDKNLVPLIDLSINFVKETGDQDEDGMPAVEEERFLEKKNGMLLLTASLETMREASSVFQGTVFKETPYAGNPTDLKTLMRCVYGCFELLFRQC
jgi:hypothetical protein